MVRNLLFTLVIVLTSNLLVFSQTGSGALKGRITDKATKEAIPFANVIVEIGGVQVGGLAGRTHRQIELQHVIPYPQRDIAPGGVAV